MFLSRDEEELVLPKCNAFLRRLIYQSVDEKLSGKVAIETRTVDKDRVLVVMKPKSKEELLQNEQKKVSEELKEMDDAVGFAKVMKAVVSSVRNLLSYPFFSLSLSRYFRDILKTG